VRQTSALLHARGTANSGDAQSFFEYWVTGATERSSSRAFIWPTGASGPFSWRAEGLTASTQYSFRVCGKDLEAPEFACAQTRTFTTPAATEDEVWGGWFSAPVFNATIRARSGPAGQSPRGSLSSSTFTGFVTCLAVSGNRAAIGAVGPDAAMLVTVIDGGPAGTDSARIATAPAPIRPNCGAASFDNQTPIPANDGGVVVTDAP
jgi:hypothetical protein